MDLNHEIEKYWREKFANEIEECIITRHDDEETKWFNQGLKFASIYIRYRFDDPIDIDDV